MTMLETIKKMKKLEEKKFSVKNGEVVLKRITENYFEMTTVIRHKVGNEVKEERFVGPITLNSLCFLQNLIEQKLK